jgi:hypothetical protein
MFTEWPAQTFAAPDSPIVIGVLGTNSFGPHLEAILRGKTVNNRPIKLRTCSSAEDAAACQIVVVAETDKAVVNEILRKLANQKVLTVSDAPEFAASGGMVGLTEVNRKVGLEVNLEAVQATGLRVDPRLLQLAKVVRSKDSRKEP